MRSRSNCSCDPSSGDNRTERFSLESGNFSMSTSKCSLNGQCYSADRSRRMSTLHTVTGSRTDLCSAKSAFKPPSVVTSSGNCSYSPPSSAGPSCSDGVIHDNMTLKLALDEDDYLQLTLSKSNVYLDLINDPHSGKIKYYSISSIQIQF